MSHIAVAVRSRPLSAREFEQGSDVCVSNDVQTVKVLQHRQGVDLTDQEQEHSFRFDAAFGPEHKTADLYQTCVRPITDAIIAGKTASVIAYGQTGSGKTHTMLGQAKGEQGLFLMAASEIFKRAKGPLSVSSYQIYCNKVTDLITGNPINALTGADGCVHLKGLQVRQVASVEQLQRVMDDGARRRVAGSTAANAQSSRSHAVLQITIPRSGALLAFVDLAGSERGKDTAMCDRVTRREGASINTSLLALKEVIRAMSGGGHVNWRGSLLTKVMQGCFAPGALCSIIATISPGRHDVEHTLNTLHYANRIKELTPVARDTVRGRGPAAAALPAIRPAGPQAGAKRKRGEESPPAKRRRTVGPAQKPQAVPPPRRPGGGKGAIMGPPPPSAAGPAPQRLPQRHAPVSARNRGQGGAVSHAHPASGKGRLPPHPRPACPPAGGGARPGDSWWTAGARRDAGFSGNPYSLSNAELCRENRWLWAELQCTRQQLDKAVQRGHRGGGAGSASGGSRAPAAPAADSAAADSDTDWARPSD